jgi:hypothetical protein
MKLIALDRFLEKYFEQGSRPSEATARRWMKDGVLPARQVGHSWYIDEHAWLANGNPLVLGVLEDG